MLTPAQFHEQAVDYLYGLLEGEALRAFEESLQASADFRSELSALEQTLLRARAALSGPLDEAPPSRARAAILASAANATGRVSVASKTDASRSNDGFWAFLRRPWLVPACGVAAACALALVMVRRVERGEEIASPPPRSVSIPAVGQAEPIPEVPNGRPLPSSTALLEPADERVRDVDERSAPRGAKGARSARSATPKAARPAVGGAASAPQAERKWRAPAPQAERKEAADEAAPRAAEPAPRAVEPAPRAAEAAPRAAEPASSAASTSASRELDAASRDELVRKARAAHAAGRSSDEARIYRALLRRFPEDRAVDAWRRALAEAERGDPWQ